MNTPKPAAPVAVPVIRTIIFRPPPGTRFSIFGSDVHLQYQEGRAREVYNWLHDWLDAYVEPEALREEAPPVTEENNNPEIAKLRQLLDKKTLQTLIDEM